jgi:carboxymethylenebutenolidase
MLRRVALLGIAAGASGPLLAACGSPGTGAPAATTPPPGRDPGTPLGNPVTFAGPSGELHGSWAAPTAAPRAAVLVVPDAQGLTPHFSDLTGRFAGAGYATLCVDLLSDHGNTATTNLADVKPEAKPGVKPAAMASAPPEKLVADLRAGIDELVRRAPGVKIGAVGFGMGGGLLWQLLNAGEPRVAAAVPFYGMAPDDLDFTRSPAAVLAIYPDNDAKLNESQDNADMAMMNANLVHNSTIYPKTTAGFFNDTDTRYDAAAAAKAWQATLDWFKQYL